MTIRDDGLGFDPLSRSGEHLGLGIMQERADLIAATLVINSRPGGGTQVTLSWQQ
jgi:two-component system nitrate/nitrite sensor histidine kinase NarX